MKYLKSLFLLAFIGMFFSGCGTTLVNLNSNPSGAKVALMYSAKQTITNSKLELNEDVFGDKEQMYEKICFYKKGYRDYCSQYTINKSRENNVNVELEKLDTSITFNSSPEGARVVLKNSMLPKGWQKTFTTPVTFVATKKEAEELNSNNFGIESIEYDGYIVPNKSRYSTIILEPGQDKTINIKMKPIITTIRIMTEPEGATVEDITQGGFGYLGETPIVRNLTWSDIVNWAERKQVKRTNGGFESIELNLRISKPGYKDVIMQSLRIPIGEERTFKRGLKELVKKINFSSDPESVHVYVNETIVQEEYDEKLGKVVVRKVNFLKHLGTTPFTYNVDPTKPLHHGDTLIFRKSGYKDAVMLYAEGQKDFHMVLEPKVIKAR